MSPDLIDWLLAGLSHASYGEMALYFLVASQITMMTSTLYLHRCATHRGVDLHRGTPRRRAARRSQ